MSDQERYSLQEAHEKFAKVLNGRSWELLGKATRTTEEDEEMVLAASASLYHWLQIGTVVHAQRGQWMLSHIYTILERPREALEYASRCMTTTESHRSEMGVFDLAYAHEALARAYALQGKVKQAKRHYHQAAEAGKAISEPEDRDIFMGDFKGGKWYGIT